MYRGPAIQYRIRKTTVNNKTGDNYAITIPRVVAETFSDVWFKFLISGGCLIFESGCKPIQDKKGQLLFDTDTQFDKLRPKKMYFEDTGVEYE